MMHSSAGLFKFGIQFTLFAVLLYYLLAAPTDPLEVAARVLPLSGTARERTIAAFSGALRAVFLSSIKLVRAGSVQRLNGKYTSSRVPNSCDMCTTCTSDGGCSGKWNTASLSRAQMLPGAVMATHNT